MFKKVDYWIELCEDDLKAAKDMLEANNFLWMGFICHLIAEKALKAAVANNTNEMPPKTHDLPKLAAKTNICNDLPENYKNLLNKLTPLQIEARYPEYKEKVASVLTERYCRSMMKETEEFLCWIKTKLGR